MHGGGLKYIKDSNPAYDPLHFTLLFPYGEQGWTTGIPLNAPWVPSSNHDTRDDLPMGPHPLANLVSVRV